VSKLRDLFDEQRVPYRLVYFEDFYTGEREQRVRNCLALVDYLGLGPVPEGGLDLLFTREQSKASHEHIANREKFLAEVTRRPGVVARAVARAREAVGAA
jgi:hypothetical protein